MTKFKLVSVLPGILAIAILSVLSTTTMAESGSGPYVIVIGAPAAGKSSASEMLSEMYGIPWINVREELLEVVEKEAKKSSRSPIPRASKRGVSAHHRRQAMKEAIGKLESGELVSDDTLNVLVASKIMSQESANGFILDGYPMTVSHAEFLDSIIEIRELAPVSIFYLNVPDEVALQRMKERDRVDDKSGFAEKRLESFRAMISPLIEYYGENAVIEIDATRSKAEIGTEISKALGS